MSRSRGLRRSSGFTLVELLVVVVVVGLISAIVLVRWSGVHQRAVAESTLQRWEALDRHLRQQARHRRRPCTLELDVAGDRFRKRYADRDKFTPWESLGHGVELVEVRLVDEKIRRERIEIAFDRAGVSPTYAVELRCPGGREVRLLAVGVSGQLTQLESDGELATALGLVASE